MSQKINITIDGPAGAGKSTVAKIVADRLNYTYLDTGAMYRAITYLALQHHISLTDETQLEQLAAKLELQFKWGSDRQLVFCNGKDITEEIRSSIVSNSVSTVAKVPGVRKEMVELQRKIARHKGNVLDGRDTGTFVLPEAECKFFLTASVEKRAERRTNELLAKGILVEVEKIQSEISARDKEDMERAVSPLIAAEDAIHIDTSSLEIPEVVAFILEIVSKKAGISQ
ncbi:MAG: (d)CMP kinase [Bacillota bacterium]|nr:(d)CMP kinase [Bacillota bacterium]